MIKRQDLSIISVLAALILSVWPGAAAARSQTRSFEAGQLSGLRIVTALALTCSDKNWQSIAGWVQKNRLTEWTNKKTTALKFDGKGAELDSPHVLLSVSLASARLASGQLEARYVLGNRQESATGDDACALIGKIVHVKAASQASLWIPNALAADLVHEERAEDEIGIGVSAALLGATLVMPPLGISLTVMAGIFSLWNAYDLVTSTQALVTKNLYEDVLNNEFTVKCDDKGMVLSSSNGRIVVAKNFNIAKIDLYAKGSETPFSGSASDAPVSSDYLVKLANDCHDAEDAARLSAQIKTQRSGAAAKIAAVSPAAKAPSLDATSKSGSVIN